MVVLRMCLKVGMSLWSGNECDSCCVLFLNKCRISWGTLNLIFLIAFDFCWFGDMCMFILACYTWGYVVFVSDSHSHL